MVLEILGLATVSLAWLMAVPGFMEPTWLVAGAGFVVSLIGLALALARRMSGLKMVIILSMFLSLSVALASPIWELHSGRRPHSTHAHWIWEIGHVH